MDMLMDGLAFAAILIGPFAAAFVVHGEHRPAPVRDVPVPDHRAKLIWEGGS
jgi:hypothetical protein